MKRFFVLLVCLLTMVHGISIAQNPGKLMNKYKGADKAEYVHINGMMLWGMKLFTKHLYEYPQKDENELREKMLAKNLPNDSIELAINYIKDSLQTKLEPLFIFNKYDISSMELLSLDSCNQEIKKQFKKDFQNFHPKGFTVIGKYSDEMVIHAKEKKGNYRELLITDSDEDDIIHYFFKGTFPQKQISNETIGEIYEEYKKKPEAYYLHIPEFFIEMGQLAEVEDSVQFQKGLNQVVMLNLKKCDEMTKSQFGSKIKQILVNDFVLLSDEEYNKNKFEVYIKAANSNIREVLLVDLTESCEFLFLSGNIIKENVGKLLEEFYIPF